MDAMTAGPAGEDLLITQGHDLDNIEQNFSSIHYREPMLLARNTGKGFVDVSAQSGDVFQQAWVARGMAVGDIFNDGTAHIIRSRADNSSHGLELKLVGHTSNRDAIGAEVKVKTSVGSQWEMVSTAGSYLSSSDKRLHFGLGLKKAATVEILWLSGIRQTLKDVHCDEYTSIDQPAGTRPAAVTKNATTHFIHKAAFVRSSVVALTLCLLGVDSSAMQKQDLGVYEAARQVFRETNFTIAARLFRQVELQIGGEIDASLFLAETLMIRGRPSGTHVSLGHSAILRKLLIRVGCIKCKPYSNHADFTIRSQNFRQMSR